MNTFTKILYLISLLFFIMPASVFANEQSAEAQINNPDSSEFESMVNQQDSDC